MTKIKHKSPISPTGVRRGERVIEGVDQDISTHPAQGNFVLLRDGTALYGGDRYYRDGYAPQSAVKPEPVHRYPEGLYQSGHIHVIIRHEPEDETYSILYIDSALEGRPNPVNRGMTKVAELGYKLVTEFKA